MEKEYIKQYYEKTNLFFILKTIFVRNQNLRDGFATPSFDEIPKNLLHSYNLAAAEKSLELRFLHGKEILAHEKKNFLQITFRKKRKRNTHSEPQQPVAFNEKEFWHETFQAWAAHDYNFTLPFSWSFPLWVYEQYCLLDVSLWVDETFIGEHLHLPLNIREVMYLDPYFAHPYLLGDLESPIIREFHFQEMSVPFAIAAIFDVVINWQHPRMQHLLPNHPPLEGKKIRLQGKGMDLTQDFETTLSAVLWIEVSNRKGFENVKYCWRVSNTTARTPCFFAGSENGKIIPSRPYMYIDTMWQEIQVLKGFVHSFQNHHTIQQHHNRKKKKKRVYLDEFLQQQSLLDPELGYLILEFYLPHIHVNRLWNKTKNRKQKK